MQVSSSTVLKSIGLMACGAAICWIVAGFPGPESSPASTGETSARQSSRPPRSGAAPDLRSVVNPANSTLSEQAKALINLSRPLDSSQTLVLLDLISAPSPAHAQSMEWACLVNEAINCLRRQPQPHPDLIPRLAALASNLSAGLILQDYAIQHLGVIYQSLSPSHPDFPLIQSVLEEAASREQRARSGTAILALGDRLALAQAAQPQPPLASSPTTPDPVSLPPAPPSPDLVSFTALLQRVISSSQSHPEARMSAFSQAANLRLSPIAPLARQVAFSTVYSIPERKTAIACLAVTGNSDDIQNLSRLAASQPDLIPAIQNAEKLFHHQN